MQFQATTLPREAPGDGPRPGTQFNHAAFPGGQARQMPEHLVHQQFRFGTRYEHPGSHIEGFVAERSPARDVLDRFPGFPPRHETSHPVAVPG